MILSYIALSYCDESPYGEVSTAESMDEPSYQTAAAMIHGYHSLHRYIAIPLILFAFGLTSRVVLYAQPNVRIENDYSSVYISKDEKCGKFWFATGPKTVPPYTRYTYRGGGTASVITSHVVFRMKVGDTYRYYCNTIPNFANGGVRPQGPNGDIDFQAYDSLYVSPNNDTCEVIWKNLGFLHITMRFVAEPIRYPEYDDGSDILVEFDYKPVGGGPAVSDFGIFMMLDGDNGTLNQSIPSDRSSVLTDRGYFPSDEYGMLFQKSFGQIPEFSMTGWFEYTDPINETFSVHRLKGTSLGGAQLTEPDMYAIGNWKDFRSLSWNVNSDLTSKQILDVATCMRWENLGLSGLVRTAFGTSSNAGNNLFHCRDSNVFVMMRTERLVRQQGVNGPYQPSEFDIEMWVTSLKRASTISPVLQLTTPIRSLPTNDRRLSLAPGQPSAVTIALGARETKKHTWRVQVDDRSEDTLVALQLLYKDSSTVDKPLVPMRQGCTPYISFRSAFIPPPPDSRDPVIQSTGNGRDATAWWTFRTFDRHPGYREDTGLDRIEIINNDNNNFRLLITPDPFVRCDTNVTVNLRAEVVDTTRTGSMTFRVYDCEGNWKEETVGYTTRPDIFKPELVRIDSIGAFDKEGYPCAVPVFEVFLEDRRNQTPSAGDAGFGQIEMVESDNFEPIQVNFDRSPLADFDPAASFRLQVTDVYRGGYAVVRVADYAGNTDTLRFYYCTIPDIRKPVVKGTPIGAGTPSGWSVEASDSAEWDRGLAEVVVISNTNMQVSPWPVPIPSGQDWVDNITVSVVDDAYDGEITLEFRDVAYDFEDPSTFDAHSERIQFRFTGIPDTIAPNIRFIRNLTVPSTDVVFNVEVDDIHDVGGSPYRYDRGLRQVNWTLTPNMRIRTPISYSADRKTALFEVEIIDPLAIVEGDTICVTGIDSAGNESSRCQAWPNTPDGKSPIFKGRLTADRSQITGTVTDDREFDRGLGSVTLRSETNLAPYSNATIGGLATAPVTINVIDPSDAIEGELVIRDLVGELDTSPEQAIHTVVIPFRLESAHLDLLLPDLVEGGETIEAEVMAVNSFSGDQIESLSFQLDFTTNVSFSGSTPGAGTTTFNATEVGGGGRLLVTMETKPGEEYSAGDKLGTIRFTTGTPYVVDKFGLSLVPGSPIANDGTERTIVVRTDGDPLASELTLPAPALRMTVDPQTVINGECNTVLTSDQTLERPTGLRILSLRPQPLGASTGTDIRMYVRDLPETDGRLELFASDGNRVLSQAVESTSEGNVIELSLHVPAGLPPGLYVLRVSGSTGADQAKVIVVE